MLLLCLKPPSSSPFLSKVKFKAFITAYKLLYDLVPIISMLLPLTNLPNYSIPTAYLTDSRHSINTYWTCSWPNSLHKSYTASQVLFLYLLKVKVKSLSRVRLFATPWTVAYHAPPPSMGFSRQEYWSGSPLPSPTGLKKQKEVCSRDTGASDPGVSLAGLHVVDFQNIFVDWVSLPNFLQ